MHENALKSPSSQKNPSPGRRVSFNENEKLGNLTELEFSKIKKTRDKDVCPIVADLMVTK